MIRPVEATDINEITSIYNYYIENTVVSFEEESVSTMDMQKRVDKVSASGLPWLVAVDREKVLGFAYADQWHNRSAYKHSVEVTVYLSHLHTAKGWGTKLYTALFKELQSKPVHTLIAWIALPNPGSLAIHEKFGFEKSAHYKQVGYKFGQWIDVAYWQKIINTQSTPIK